MVIRLNRIAVLAVCVASALLIASCKVIAPYCDEAEYQEACPPHHSKLAQHPTMMALAHDLDKVEKHIEWFGTVVPKSPDVWGQARLTKHREEFEQVMSADLYGFDVKLNGSLARADQAFFAQSVALGIAARPSRRILPGERTVTTTRENNVSNVIDNTVKTATETQMGKTTDTTGKKETVVDKTEAAKEVAVPDAEKLLIDLMPGKDLKEIEKARVGFGTLKTAGIGLEPTLVLEQKARYLNLLNQIRRTNEGDDTADAPGYSLNLVRIPVSIFPGQKTEAGYGAEITFTLTSVLSDELLPTTFRNLVLNDLIDQIGYPLVKFLEDPETRDDLEDTFRIELQNEEFLQQFAAGSEPPVMPPAINGSTPPRGKAPQQRSDKAKQFATKVRKRITIPSLAPTKGVQARAPFPNSQIVDVYGLEYAFEVAYQAYGTFKKDIEINGYAHLPDLQSYLQSELNAAYRFLSEPGNQGLWTTFCTPELVTAVRNRNDKMLAEMRRAFREHFRVVSGSRYSPPPREANQPELMQFSVTAGLAWAILVDAALLTDRLVQDMQTTAAAKGCAPFCGGWLDFYLPHPSPEARQAFNGYVQCRWPIHVFALDPANQEQNLADTLSTRRETQLALSLAFVSGQISARSLTRYARRLEAEYETIALNRTHVGFSYGENTFGWRFMPRFQTPDTEPNLTVLVRDQLIGGPSRDALLRQRRLEPGPRECVAIVLMPAFVPYLTCDSVANWFCLTNPKHKAFDHTQAMRVSQAIKTLQVRGPSVGDADCYRDGDFHRLLRRVEQLDARLPTQTMTVQVPVLNTVGGFEMFNSGTTDLAPELYGFYGAPGARTDAFTTLFLVGDHFSPLRSKVIVGNKECETEMLSRQVVKVRVPPQVLPTNDSFLHAHLATPYGVSREIPIPLARPLGEPKEQFALAVTNWDVHYTVDKVAENKYQYTFRKTVPESVTLIWVGPPAKRPAAVDLKLDFQIKDKSFSVTVPNVPSSEGVFRVPLAEVGKKILAEVNASVELKSPEVPPPWIGLLRPVAITVTPTGQSAAVPLLPGPVELRAIRVPKEP